METSTQQGSHPMRPIVTKWLSKIKLARKVKQERFGKFADEAMKFYSANHDFMWSQEYSQGHGGFLAKGGQGMLPKFRFTFAKAFEMVALFGPALYHQNPNVQVTPLLHPHVDPLALGLDASDPNVASTLEQFAATEAAEAARRSSTANVASSYLNWVIQEQDLKVSARRAVVEAIIKGMAIVWCEIFESPGGEYRYPKATFVSVDDLVVDPDADYQEDILWVARRCVHAVNLVERKYKLPPGSLKGNMQSLASQATASEKDRRSERNGKRGKSHDLIEYWEVYSKNGFGDRLKGMEGAVEKSQYDWSALGDHCYLAVAEGVPYPLNIPTESLKEEEDAIFERAAWPIPFWVDEGCNNGWPFARLAFYEKPRDVWPEGIFKACIGELRFINWCMSFLADKTAAACHTYVAQQKSAGIEIQDQLKSGMAPYTVLEISEITGKSINEVVSFLQAPSFPMEVWKMVSEVMAMIDKRTGLTELLYGLTNRQIRSATEAQVRDDNLSVRPDDMASRVEDWLSDTAMKLAEAGLWTIGADEVEPILGQMGAAIWQQMQVDGIDKVVRNYDFRIEAGTARKPNKGNKISQLNEFGQFALPTIQALAMQGQVGPWNAYISEWAKLMEYDPSAFLAQPPPPPPSPEESGPSPQQIKMESAMQQMQMDQARWQQEMTQDSERFKQDMMQSKAEHKQKLDAAKKTPAPKKKKP